MYLRHLVCLYCQEPYARQLQRGLHHPDGPERQHRRFEQHHDLLHPVQSDQGSTDWAGVFHVLSLANQFELQAKRSLMARLREGGKLIRN